jgi:hypothetical protein
MAAGEAGAGTESAQPGERRRQKELEEVTMEIVPWDFAAARQ